MAALGFYIVKRSPFDLIYFDALKGSGAVLMAGGVLILLTSTGGMAKETMEDAIFPLSPHLKTSNVRSIPPRTVEDVIYGARDIEQIKRGESDALSGLVQDFFIFSYGLILGFILYFFHDLCFRKIKN